MSSNVNGPLNLGSDELVSINELLRIVEKFAGLSLKRKCLLDAWQGVRGRNSDNTLIKEKFGWMPSIKLAHGLEKTYRWEHDRMCKSPRTKMPACL